MDELLKKSNHAEDQFIKSWINRQLKEKSDEKTVMEYIYKLQLISQDLESGLDKATAKLTAAMPRCVGGLERIFEENTALQGDLKSVAVQVAKISTKNRDIASRLGDIDGIKKKMTQCITTLSEIDNWKKRLEHVENLMKNRNFLEIAKELEAMKKSVNLLQNISRFSGREKEVDALMKDLETMATPHLLEAIHEHDNEKLDTFKTVFRRIGQEKEIKEFYKSSRLEAARNIAVRYNTPKSRLLDWFATFLAELKRMLEEEVVWCNETFDNPEELTSQLFISMFEELNPECRGWLKEAIEQASSTGRVTVVVKIWKMWSHFVDDLGTAPAIKLLNPVPTLTSSSSFIFTASRTLFDKLERLTMDSVLDDLDLPTTVKDAPPKFEEVVQQMLGASHEALSRCLDFSHGALAKGVCSNLRDFYKKGCGRVVSALGQIKRDLKTKAATPEKKSQTEDFLSSPMSNSEWSSDLPVSFELLGIVTKFTRELDVFINKADTETKTYLQELLATDTDISPTVAVQRELLSPTVRTQKISVAKLLNSIKDRVTMLRNPIEDLILTIMLLEVELALVDFISKDVWSERQKKSRLPDFGVQPTNEVQQVGGHLLRLVELIEPAQDKTTDEDGADEEIDLVYWLQKAFNASAGKILGEFLKLKAISARGTKQLLTDLDYLVNLASAICVDPPVFLSHVTTVLTAKLSDKERLKEMDFDNEFEKSVIIHLAQLRNLLPRPPPKETR